MTELVSSPSMPHDRETLEILQLISEAYEFNPLVPDPPFLALVITDTEQYKRWILDKVRNGVVWIGDREIKIHRDGVEFVGNGSRIVIMTYSDPGRLMGHRPNKIFLFGKTGELFYWLRSMNCDIKAVA